MCRYHPEFQLACTVNRTSFMMRTNEPLRRSIDDFLTRYARLPLLLVIIGLRSCNSVSGFLRGYELHAQKWIHDFFLLFAVTPKRVLGSARNSQSPDSPYSRTSIAGTDAEIGCRLSPGINIQLPAHWLSLVSRTKLAEKRSSPVRPRERSTL